MVGVGDTANAVEIAFIWSELRGERKFIWETMLMAFAICPAVLPSLLEVARGPWQPAQLFA